MWPLTAFAHVLMEFEDCGSTVSSIGCSSFLWKNPSETSSSGPKNHSHRASQLVMWASTRVGLPCVCSSPSGARYCDGEISRKSGRDTDWLHAKRSFMSSRGV